MVPDRQQINGGVEARVQQQVVLHHIFAYLAIPGNRIKLAFQAINSVAGLHRADGPFKKQPAHAGKALKVGDDGVSEFIQQRVKSLRRVGFQQKALGLFEIALEVRSEFDLMPSCHRADTNSAVRLRRTAALQRGQGGPCILYPADGDVFETLANIVNQQQVNAFAL